jgi:hypothetical protein
MMALLALWLLCGIGGAGFMFAYFQDEYPESAESQRREDLGMATLFGAFGPVALVAGFLFSGFGKHGWRLWPVSADRE